MKEITIRLGDGYVAVEPEVPQELRDALRYWRRTLEWDPASRRRKAQGKYENLHTIETYVAENGEESRRLVTMTGFAFRVRKLLTDLGYECTVIDTRTPMPAPNMEKAFEGLRDYQIEGAYVALMSGGGIISAATGYGKCEHSDNLQLHYDGTVKRAGDVKVGDVLMGDDSTPRKVLERIDGHGPMYKITPLTGDPFIVADHHILCLVQSGTCANDRYPDGHIVEITVEDYLNSTKTFKHRHKLYRVPVEYPRKEVSVDPYFIGVWLGDGDWHKPAVTNPDREIIDYIYKYAEELDMNVTAYHPSGPKKTYSYAIVKKRGRNSKLMDMMRSYGLLKSKERRIPREYLINDRETRLQLLAGILDTDGSLDEGSVFDFTGTQQEFVKDVETLARSLGFRVNAVEREVTGFGLTKTARRLTISGNTHLIPTRVERKKARVRAQKKDPLRTSFTVEKVEDSPYVGVMLDGNGRYLLGDCTVTHNTHVMKSIVNAYSPEDLKLRGTPLSVLAVADKDIAFKNFVDIEELLPDREVGLIMSGKRKVSDDVQVITLDSLHHLDPDDIGLLIVDEVHSSASDSRAASITGITKALKWGVSATPFGRFDGGDLVTEGLFGPIVYTRTYQQSVADGALVPIKVYWIETEPPPIGLDMYLKYIDRNSKYRHGLWRHTGINQTIGEILRWIPDNLQTLCIMQFIEQMYYIRKECDDDVQIVHAETSDKALAKYPGIHPVSPKDRRAIYDKMAEAEISKILSTHVYKQGVNFPHLELVINAGGGGSDIVAKQIPGRESRKTADKTESYLVDFWHGWDMDERKRGPLLADDNARKRAYNNLGLEQIWIKDIDMLPFLEQKK